LRVGFTQNDITESIFKAFKENKKPWKIKWNFPDILQVGNLFEFSLTHSIVCRTVSIHVISKVAGKMLPRSHLQNSKGIGLKRGNKGQLTWRQKNNVFSAILE